ncbi:hypothetical protein F362_gp55 [Enterobacter phage EcP1]|uniref:Uncharacterized protein n=1 Tax=Enterobacter phage EcP1 TaxID=942016 RepID=E9NII0_9CAUD|nr:hypothetical protein F362_gp55 [Enterobacter phage EcP1]ADU79206.1 hypothetical protein EcP1_gp55 [Enterobacter phage EcP1]
MTDQTQISEEAMREALRAEATTLGISFSPNISNETLQKRIEEHRAELAEKSKGEPEVNTQGFVVKNKMDAEKLVRVRITLMNQDKRQMTGEIISVGNSVVGFYKKFIPFDPKFYENGYHVPQIIVNALIGKKHSVAIPAKVNGIDTTTFQLVPEFHVEILPALTEDELKALAKEQSAEQRIGGN